ncbi:MAG TPA: DsbA family protein [Adhaeribacter sp.]|nr:DsbA family protein [Adhaeribacter sp.]
MKKPVVYYIFDTLCGWCYGFAPVINQLQQELGPNVTFTAISGGMVTGERIGPITQMAVYIKRSAPRVTEVSGVAFGNAYLEGVLNDENYISNSVPPAIALNIFRTQQPGKQLYFAHAIQKLIFEEGKDLNQPEIYLPLAEEAGLTSEEFRKRFEDPKVREDVEKEFTLVQNWGISGFPAVVVEKKEKLYLVAQGFQPLENLSGAIKEVLEKE